MSFTTASLTFGAINLTGGIEELSDDGWKMQAAAEGTDWSNPEPIDATVTSWLQDGAIIARSGYNNRPDMTVALKISAVDANKLALAEQALVFETGKPNELIWTPPGVDAEPCVFSVVMSNLEHQMDDLGEIEKLPYRIYVLRIQAEPFVRALDPVTVVRPAPTPSGSITVTSIDPCTSTTGWAGYPNTATTSGGSILETKSVAGGSGAGLMRLERTGLAVNMASTPFLRLDYSYARFSGDNPSITVTINGVVSTPVATSGTVEWHAFSGTLNAVKVQTFDGTALSLPRSQVLRFNDISRSNAPADPGATGREVSGTMAVAGSARSQGGLLLSDPTAGLGDVLVYTCPVTPTLVQPPLRALLTSSVSPTPDASTVSGAYSDLFTYGHTFTIPSTGLLPGGHLLMARIKHASSGTRQVTTFTFTAQGGTHFLDDSEVTDVTLSAGIWKIVPVARLNLPGRKTGSSGVTEISMGASSGVVLDEAWLFNVELGSLTQVSCGTGTGAAGGPSNRLWLDAPTIASPRPAVYLGSAADRSDSYHAASEMTSFGVHSFPPPLVNIFTVATGSTASVASLTHWPHFLSHVAKAA